MPQKRYFYQLEDVTENGQKDLGKKSEITKFAQLQEGENMIVVLKNVRNDCKKKKKSMHFFPSSVAC